MDGQPALGAGALAAGPEAKEKLSSWFGIEDKEQERLLQDHLLEAGGSQTDAGVTISVEEAAGDGQIIAP